ncbi:MAG TPA: NADH:flavin oxidoreductase/NADH oxidase [Dongiaceae bacterium]
MSEPILFSPLQLRGLTLRNRAVLSPMCQYEAVEGRMQDWHFRHHARFAAGGLAAAFVEATGVTRDGRITHGCTGIYDDSQLPGLKRVVETYRAHGTVPGIQLAHAGRRASALRPWDGAKPIEAKTGPEAAWQTVAPSPLPEREGYPIPRELTLPEIDELVAAFAQAARRALSVGFEIVEIHGAHGYLTHSFFSPHSNKRSDDFGGSLEKRMRFPLLVAEAVRAVWPAEKPVFYRASVTDNIEGGLPVEDSVALARELKARGIDVIDCSAGGMSGSVSLGTSKIRPGYQVDLAAAVRRGAEIPTMAVGAIIEPRQAEAILVDGDADLVALGRQMIAEPHWLYRAAQELGLANPAAVLPRNYSFYLERRAAVLER